MRDGQEKKCGLGIEMRDAADCVSGSSPLPVNLLAYAQFSPYGSRVTRHASRFRSCSSLITHHPSRSHGYTLIELVVVIVILAVIAGIAGPRFFDTKVFSERGYADEVASAMRYAQKIAVASGCSVRLSITTSGYSAMQQASNGLRCTSTSASWTTVVKRPDGDALAGTPPSDANISGAATLIFDTKGAVSSGATNLTIGAYTLVIDASSGMVVVQ
jgi:MSHA pilin protein MshC